MKSPKGLDNWWDKYAEEHRCAPGMTEVVNWGIVFGLNKAAKISTSEERAKQSQINFVSSATHPPDRSAHLLMVFKGGSIASCKCRPGILGEPQQEVIAWRTDESGCFATPLYWCPLPKMNCEK